MLEGHNGGLAKTTCFYAHKPPIDSRIRRKSMVC